MSKKTEIIEPNGYVEIEVDVYVQNQSNLPVRACETIAKPRTDEGFVIEPLKVLKFVHESKKLWLHNPNTSPITVGYNPEIV